MPGKYKTNNSNATEDDEPEEIESEEELFIIDSFQGDINLGTSAGRTLFSQATKGLKQSKRINVTLGNAK